MRAAAALCLAALAACGPNAPGPDAAELEMARARNFVPKSSPAALVGTFDAVCTLPPAVQEPRARDLGYVPAEPARQNRAARLFVVDNTRPALRVGARLCLVEAIARTGQTRAARAHVARAHPQARPLLPRGPQVEQLWLLPDGGLIATRRWRDAQNLVRYSLIRYRDGAA